MSARAWVLGSTCFASVTFSASSFAIPFSPVPIFLQSYEASRAAFLALGKQAEAQFSGVVFHSIEVPSKKADDLTIDTLYIPAQEAPDQLVILSSGVHGVEGAPGAAVQRLLLTRMLRDERWAFRPKRTGFLFVHAVNPFGFKYGRSVTENNIDLNHNFAVSNDLFQRKNAGYTRLEELLGPSKPATYTWRSHMSFLLRTLRAMTLNSFASMHKAVAQGQYEFPKGLYYGGSAPEPQNAPLINVIKSHGTAYSRVLLMDLHTGFGPRIVFQVLSEGSFSSRKQSAEGHSIPTTFSNTAAPFPNTGAFTSYVEHALRGEGKRALALHLDFGTVDTQTRTGAVRAVNRMILENQRSWYGSTDPRSTTSIRIAFNEMFFPADVTWRRALLTESEGHIPAIIERFVAIP